jgi:thioredoxin 1
MEITSTELKKKIESGEKVLVDFFASWCGPCKVMKPWFEKVAADMKEKNSGVELYTFNIENDKEFAVNELGIRSVPTIKGFNEGKEVYHNVGVLRMEQLQEVAQSL